MGISYSLGDAIDWKRFSVENVLLNFFSLLLARVRDRLETQGLEIGGFTSSVSYSLGDAIDWKLNFRVCVNTHPKLSYSLGDAIDWKLGMRAITMYKVEILLLARGRD